MKIQNILCPVDFSTHSRAAVDFTVAIAKQFGAKIHFVHSMLSNSNYAGSYPHVENEIEAERKRAHDSLYRISPEGVSVDHVVLEGLPARKVIEYASHEPIDLIVMATHGRTGLTRFLMGSFAEEVLRGAPCPVLTLKSKIPAVQDSEVTETTT